MRHFTQALKNYARWTLLAIWLKNMVGYLFEGDGQLLLEEYSFENKAWPKLQASTNSFTPEGGTRENPRFTRLASSRSSRLVSPSVNLGVEQRSFVV